MKIECARMASVEESKVLLSQILEKEFSEALQDSESFNKMKVTAIIQQAMTGFVREGFKKKKKKKCGIFHILTGGGGKIG